MTIVITDALIIAVLSAIAPTVTSVASLIASLRNHKKLTETKYLVNGRITELIDALKTLARIEATTGINPDNIKAVAEVIDAERAERLGKYVEPEQTKEVMNEVLIPVKIIGRPGWLKEWISEHFKR